MKSIEQRLFDKSVKAIIKQGQRSLSNFGKCMYRGASNRRCAVGWLITDDNYSPDLENKNLSDIGVLRAVNKSQKTKMHRNYKAYRMLGRLQNAHDDNGGDSFVEDFIISARVIAKSYNLNTKAFI